MFVVNCHFNIGVCTSNNQTIWRMPNVWHDDRIIIFLELVPIGAGDNLSQIDFRN